MTISTSNSNSTLGGGAAQVSFVSPSGTNSYHGNAYWYNRNSVFAANDWYNNKDGIEKPFLNQNQFGGSLGGPIVKDKLLFYGNYEVLRLRQQELADRTILTADARRGFYTYRDSAGQVRSVNILQTKGVQIDPHIADLLTKVPGPGRRLNYSPLSRVLSGWIVGGNMIWQSGSPFSVLSTRGTFNRGARSATNTAGSTLGGDQLDEKVGFFMSGNGPMFIHPSAIGSDGRGVGADGAAPFNGQIFVNPSAGEIGALQRRSFNGPWTFNLDFSIVKRTQITERQSLELRMEAFNSLITPHSMSGMKRRQTRVSISISPRSAQLFQMPSIPGRSNSVCTIGSNSFGSGRPYGRPEP